MRLCTSSRVKRKRFLGKVNSKFDNLIRGAWYCRSGPDMVGQGFILTISHEWLDIVGRVFT